jgi:hypothetical protein
MPEKENHGHRVTQVLTDTYRVCAKRLGVLGLENDRSFHVCTVKKSLVRDGTSDLPSYRLLATKRSPQARAPQPSA